MQGRFIQGSNHFPLRATVTLRCSDLPVEITSHPRLYFPKFSAWPVPSQSKPSDSHWRFRSQEKKRLRVLYLPGFPPILLPFSPLCLSSPGVSHQSSESAGLFHHGGPGPGSGPRPADLQHGGRGHWEGGCSAPTHTAAFSTLPRECLPSLPPSLGLPRALAGCVWPWMPPGPS